MQSRLNQDDLEFFLALFESFTLEEIGVCLQVIARCMHVFVEDLLKALVETPVFLEKIKKADHDDFRVQVWLRFCEALRSVDRQLFSRSILLSKMC
jgi:hypothetical protein